MVALLTTARATALGTLNTLVLLIVWPRLQPIDVGAHGGSLRMENMVRTVELDFDVHESKTIEIFQRFHKRNMSLSVVDVGVAVPALLRLNCVLIIGVLWLVETVSNQWMLRLLIQPHLVSMFLKNPYFHFDRRLCPITQLMGITQLRSVSMSCVFVRIQY